MIIIEAFERGYSRHHRPTGPMIEIEMNNSRRGSPPYDAGICYLFAGSRQATAPLAQIHSCCLKLRTCVQHSILLA